MKNTSFTTLRKELDQAITYADATEARTLAHKGLSLAQYKESLGEIMYFTAQIAIIDENYATAIRFLDLAIKYAPFDGAAYNDRALCMIELGDPDSALDYFNKGIEVEPDYATIYHNKGWFLHQSGDEEQALICLKKALKLEPDRAVTYENLASVYIKLGRLHDALDSYNKALMVMPPSCEAINHQIQTAINHLEKRIGEHQ